MFGLIEPDINMIKHDSANHLDKKKGKIGMRNNNSADKIQNSEK